MIFIGDCHGKTERLQRILQGIPKETKVYQVGDMGLGFEDVILPEQRSNFKFIRGNHDSPQACQAHPNYLGEYGYVQEDDLFYLGGGWSIDRNLRIPNVSWWADEELSVEQLEDAFALYVEKKPKIVMTHECPESIGRVLVPIIGNNHLFVASKTALHLQKMFEAHKPRYWVFGHWHYNKNMKIDGTLFRCVAELSQAEIAEGCN